MVHLSASLWEFCFLWSAAATFNVLNLLYTKLSDSQVLLISSAQILLYVVVQQHKMVNYYMFLHCIYPTTQQKRTWAIKYIKCVLKISVCATCMLFAKQPLIPSPGSSLKHSSYTMILLVDLWPRHLSSRRKALVYSEQEVIFSSCQ